MHRINTRRKRTWLRATATTLALGVLATGNPTAQESVLGTYGGAVEGLRDQLDAGQLIGVAVEAADQRICGVDRDDLARSTRQVLNRHGLEATIFTGDGPVLTLTVLILPLTRQSGTARQLLGCAITATVLIGINVEAEDRALVALVGNSTKTWVIGTGSPTDSVKQYVAQVARELARKIDDTNR